MADPTFPLTGATGGTGATGATGGTGATGHTGATGPAMTASRHADATYEAALQAIIASGSSKSAPLRAQAQALMKQALALEGPDIQIARQRLQQHRQSMRRQG